MTLNFCLNKPQCLQEMPSGIILRAESITTVAGLIRREHILQLHIIWSLQMPNTEMYTKILNLNVPALTEKAEDRAVLIVLICCAAYAVLMPAVNVWAEIYAAAVEVKYE